MTLTAPNGRNTQTRHEPRGARGARAARPRAHRARAGERGDRVRVGSLRGARRLQQCVQHVLHHVLGRGQPAAAQDVAGAARAGVRAGRAGAVGDHSLQRERAADRVVGSDPRDVRAAQHRAVPHHQRPVPRRAQVRRAARTSPRRCSSRSTATSRRCSRRSARARSPQASTRTCTPPRRSRGSPASSASRTSW